MFTQKPMENLPRKMNVVSSRQSWPRSTSGQNRGSGFTSRRPAVISAVVAKQAVPYSFVSGGRLAYQAAAGEAAMRA